MKDALNYVLSLIGIAVIGLVLFTQNTIEGFLNPSATTQTSNLQQVIPFPKITQDNPFDPCEQARKLNDELQLENEESQKTITHLQKKNGQLDREKTILESALSDSTDALVRARSLQESTNQQLVRTNSQNKLLENSLQEAHSTNKVLKSELDLVISQNIPTKRRAQLFQVLFFGLLSIVAISILRRGIHLP
ncbi:MAG: hypothetical protein AAFO07_19100 [Bacteroidota bacterium]